MKSTNDLRPGQKVEGWVTFEVTKTARKVTLVHAPGFLGEPVEVALNQEAANGFCTRTPS